MSVGNVGRFIWYEHMTHDPAAAVVFYSEVIGWKTQPYAQGMDYTLWVNSQGPLGGVMKLPEEAKAMGARPTWMANVIVEDVEATVALVKKLGGKVYKAPSDIPNVGRFSVIADPQGASIAVFQPLQPMTPQDDSKDGAVCWHELNTSDRAAAFGFYSRLFGWESVQEMDMGPMGVYQIYGLGDKHLGGMMNRLDPSSHPMWGYYIETADLNAAIARATRHGAKVTMGSREVPGGAHIAQLVDPQGAAFALHQQSKA